MAKKPMVASVPRLKKALKNRKEILGQRRIGEGSIDVIVNASRTAGGQGRTAVNLIQAALAAHGLTDLAGVIIDEACGVVSTASGVTP